MLGDRLEHRPSLSVFETGPPHFFIWGTPAIGPFGEDASLHRLFETRCLQLFYSVKVIKAPEKEQVRDLFDDFERIRDPARPEGIPEGVDLVADVSSQHIFGSPVSHDSQFTRSL
jgi:hypothetical protein